MVLNRARLLCQLTLHPPFSSAVTPTKRSPLAPLRVPRLPCRAQSARSVLSPQQQSGHTGRGPPVETSVIFTGVTVLLRPTARPG